MIVTLKSVLHTNDAVQFKILYHNHCEHSISLNNNNNFCYHVQIQNILQN